MSGERIYPDEPADSFPTPPATFEDREGREIEIRAFEPSDEEALVEMYDKFDPSDRAQGIPPSTEQRVRDWLELILDEGHNVLAVHDGTIAGHATLVPDGADAYELAIFVTQEYQRAGIGGRLIRLLLGYGTEQDVEHVWLTVERWNRAAVALYEDVGFEPSGTESFELEMSLRLH
jgi:RimJ/RimL family protein N-acetyltransferase